MIRISHINPPTITSTHKVDLYIKRYYYRKNKFEPLTHVFNIMAIRGGLHLINDPNGFFGQTNMRPGGVIRRGKLML